jgi:hypothetical protein
VDDALLVAGVHGPGQGLHQLRRRPRRQRGAVEVVCQAAAGTELEREERQAVVLADLVDLHDVGVVQAGDGLGLGAEAVPVGRAGVAARQDHLQRHHPVGLHLARLVDDAHAALGDYLQDLVTEHPWPAGGRRRGRRPLVDRHGRGRRLRPARFVRSQRGGGFFHQVLAGEEAGQVAGQVRVTGQQPLPLGRPAVRAGLQKGGQDFVEPSFRFVLSHGWCSLSLNLRPLPSPLPGKGPGVRGFRTRR